MSSRPAKLGRLSLLLVGALAAGCVSFYPVETTPEAILRTVHSGDTVRMTTREREELEMRVWTVGDEYIRGDTGGGPSALRAVRLDLIESIEIEQPNLKKAMLAILLPALIGIAVICHNQGCESSWGLSTSY